MFWAIGAIIVGAVAYRYNDLHEQAAFRYVHSILITNLSDC
jgi:hypothetical protein